MSSLHDYTRLQKLGMGSFATTHLVQHKQSGKQSVLKRIPCKHLRAANAALLEVKVLLACHHVNITAYHDFFLDSDSDENIVICLLMEFCAGGDLWERIAAAQRKREVLPAAQSTGWLLQIIAALRYLHSCGILHRDVKPENIFITQEDSVVKLGDFGLAKGGETAQEGNATTQCGTPDYMAPEVLEGKVYTSAADVFSLGAVLYALITSRFPKMLALHLGQGKALEWPDHGPGQEAAQQLAACMLRLDTAKREALDQIALRAAELPGSQMLQGQSLIAREAAKLPVPPQPKPTAVETGEAAAKPASARTNGKAACAGVPAAVGAVASSSGGASSAVAAAPLPPSRPETPVASEVRVGSLTLHWKRAPAAEGVLGYRVLLQAGGSEGFREVIADTGRPEPVVRLDGLRPATWYEVKVCALSASGSSPPSPPCSPVQTLDEEPGFKQSPRRTASEALDDSGLQARYSKTKEELLQWETDFERGHGRAATEREKAADAAYQELLQAYKRLKQAKRRSNGSGLGLPEVSEGPAAPRERASNGGGGAARPLAGASTPEKATTPPKLRSGSGGAEGGGGEDEGEMTFSEEEMETAAKLFESYDTDADGNLSLSEFMALMQALAASSGRPLSNFTSSLEDLFRRADKEGRGYLDFGAFLQMQRKRRRMKGLFRASGVLLSEVTRLKMPRPDGPASPAAPKSPAKPSTRGGNGPSPSDAADADADADAVPRPISAPIARPGQPVSSSPRRNSPRPVATPVAACAAAAEESSSKGKQRKQSCARGGGASSSAAAGSGSSPVSRRPTCSPCAARSGSSGGSGGSGSSPTVTERASRARKAKPLEPTSTPLPEEGEKEPLPPFPPQPPPGLDRARRSVPERTETKGAVAAEPPPQVVTPPSSDKKKAAPAAKKAAEPPPERTATKTGPLATNEGFRVAVKASHPSPRPFAANDLTFD